MLTKSIAAAALAVLLATMGALVPGAASTVLAQYASPGPTYVPNGYDVPNGYAARHQRRGIDDTNGW